MKAATFHVYGSPDVLHLENVPKPTPKDGEVLIRVHASSVSYADLLVRNFGAVGPRRFNMPFLFWLLARISFGVLRPRVHVLGSEFSGVVEAVGANVKRFAPGDAVFGYTGPRMGAEAEYLCLPEHAFISRKPANISHEQAATLPFRAMIALDLLERCKPHTGARILVNGASGGIGAMAVQIAKACYGATVTGVCGTASLDSVRALGADEVIDYNREDFVARGQRYDLIIDVLGKCWFEHVRPTLAAEGCIAYVSFKERQLLQMLITALTSGPKVVCMVLSERQQNLDLVRDLVEAGQLHPQIDRVFPLSEAAEAHRYAEGRARKGPVVLSVPAPA